ncbi:MULTISPECIES: Fic family protein [Streptomyces]|uniref:Fic family protein n=1 Tax=Streptomyces TaxID=1883 RepID=UPI000A9DE900
MSEFIDWLNEGDLDAPVHVRAAGTHLNLVKIHPWKDGNGRMSRVLSTLVFSREPLMPPESSSIEEWLGRAQNTYAYYACVLTPCPRCPVVDYRCHAPRALPGGCTRRDPGSTQCPSVR